MRAQPNPFAGKKILITGLNGFLGSHLSAGLQASGAVVEGISRNPAQATYLESFPQAKPRALHAIDLRDYAKVESFFGAHSYDFIFHLASQADTWKSSQLPLETFETNVLGTLHLMEALRVSAHAPPVILSGSVRAFEYTNAITRGAPPSMHLYDASKFGMEMIASSYFHTYGMHGAIAQNTNMYGPNDLNFNRLIPKIMQGIFSDGAVKLKGNGLVKRDFMYVEDAIAGLINLGSHVVRTGMKGGSFTFASGTLVSIREVAHLLEELIPGAGKIQFDNIPLSSDRDQSGFDIAGTQQALGWIPRVSFAEGINKTAAWYHEYFAARMKKTGGNPI